MRLSRELLMIYLAAFLRALGIGLLGVVLGVYLFRVGLDSAGIGLVLAAGLAVVLGGSLKITYDLLLYRGFRHLKRPEERSLSSVPPGPLATSHDAHQHS